MESFSFNHSLGEVNVNLTFVVPEYKTCMGVCSRGQGIWPYGAEC